MSLSKKQKQARVNEINKLAKKANSRARALEKYGADPKHTALKYYNEGVAKYNKGHARFSEHQKYNKNLHHQKKKIMKFLNAKTSTVRGLQSVDRKRMLAWNRKIQQYGKKNGLTQKEIANKKFKSVDDFRSFVKSDYWNVMRKTYSSGQSIAAYVTTEKDWEEVIEETTPFFENLNEDGTSKNKEDIAKSLGFEMSGDLVKAEMGLLKRSKKKKR